MMAPFLYALRRHGLGTGLHEYLEFLRALKTPGLIDSIDEFYILSRTILMGDEKQFDRFDRAFGEAFNGVLSQSSETAPGGEIPQEWLRKLQERFLTEEERRQIEEIGGFDKLMETLRERLRTQKDRHQGGNKWIGTAGTSPFGAYGYNPAGVRIGQDKSRHQRAVKVWDKRLFRDYADEAELSPRAMKIALSYLRQWGFSGAQDELDLESTIKATSQKGYLDIHTRPERRNTVKVLLLLDVGGSMDPYVNEVSHLFGAARHAFKHLEQYYFHNCLYDFVWRKNQRRWDEKELTHDLFNRFNSDWRCIFVGDASMSPYEVSHIGGANEYWNDQSGADWLMTARKQWPRSVWINPMAQTYWPRSASTQMIQEVFEDQMFALTLGGIRRAMQALQ